jgi:hypothetical protein
MKSKMTIMIKNQVRTVAFLVLNLNLSLNLNHCFLGFGRWRGLSKKPTAVSSRGFLLNFGGSTSANGVAGYNDDHIDNL